MNKPYFVRTFIILLFLLSANLTAQTITFHVDNLKAGPADCNWMFDSDDLVFFTHDGNPFTYFNQYPFNNYAYRNFVWSSDAGYVSAGTGTAENTNLIDGTAGLTLRLDGFSLKSFRHTNTVNANNPWNILGQAGDERIYGGGTGEIYVDGVLKLRVTNCRLSVTTPYPTAAQMNTIAGIAGFQNNVGTGVAVTGSGWGAIDQAAGDAAWRAAFDPNGTGQIEYTLSTVSAVIQNNYGYFDFDIVAGATNFQENLNFAAIPAGADPAPVALSGSGVSVDFSGVAEDYGNIRSVLANQIKKTPAGSLPSDVATIANSYWHLGTTLKTFSSDVTFDISSLPGITDASKLCILKRNNSNAVWEKLSNVTIAGDGNSITAAGVTSFSEFAVASTDAKNPLPVELISLTASVGEGNKAVLKWATATEINNLGFDIERRFGTGSFEKIGFVPGRGNSNTVNYYEYTDRLPASSSVVTYRLKQTDFDGAFKLSSEVTVTQAPASFALKQNYPNPANPSTKIRFSLGKPSHARLAVYDILGNELLVLLNGITGQGEHEVTLDGSHLASGVYYYRLTSGGHSESRKLMILK